MLDGRVVDSQRVRLAVPDCLAGDAVFACFATPVCLAMECLGTWGVRVPNTGQPVRDSPRDAHPQGGRVDN